MSEGNSNIATLLNQILTAIYGKDVRQSIHDAIKQCYSDVGDTALNQEAFKKALDAAIADGSIGALTIGDKSITGSKIADLTITGDKVNFLEKKIFDKIMPISDTPASGNHVYTLPFVVGTPYIYIIAQEVSGMGLTKALGRLHAKYGNAANSWSQYNVNLFSTLTDPIWSYPDSQTSATYPWTNCYKFDCTALNAYFELSELSGTQNLTLDTISETLVNYYGYNEKKSWDDPSVASVLWLTTEPTITDWKNDFPTDTKLNASFGSQLKYAKKYVNLFYNAADYGLSVNSDDNTASFQELINTVYDNGGGVIYIPNGIYKFDTSSGQYISGSSGPKRLLSPKAGICIIGESSSKTILKITGSSDRGVALFGYFGTFEAPLDGIGFSNFTVDGSDCTISEYSSDGKAFYIQFIKNSIFRDLVLKGTPATALGIDYLDNVVVDSIYCYNAGRIHSENSPGGAGIGIGTGKWENENFIIRNCICDSCGHFGIFLEDQSVFNSGSITPKYPKGQIISNNICRNGRNYGFGLRGGKYVTFIGNQAYGNSNGGLFMDFVNTDIQISNNMLVSNPGSGICFGNEKPETLQQSFTNIFIEGNKISENSIGINIIYPADNVSLLGNDISENTSTDISITGVQTGLYVSGNLVTSSQITAEISYRKNIFSMPTD